ncbi:MAG: hypothetical protein LBJ93_03290 [Clostridiales bacterium]|nr:hypothetical protein [Clostridiales bacterium]
MSEISKLDLVVGVDRSARFEIIKYFTSLPKDDLRMFCSMQAGGCPGKFNLGDNFLALYNVAMKPNSKLSTMYSVNDQYAELFDIFFMILSMSYLIFTYTFTDTNRTQFFLQNPDNQSLMQNIMKIFDNFCEVRGRKIWDEIILGYGGKHINDKYARLLKFYFGIETATPSGLPREVLLTPSQVISTLNSLNNSSCLQEVLGLIPPTLLNKLQVVELSHIETQQPKKRKRLIRKNPISTNESKPDQHQETGQLIKSCDPQENSSPQEKIPRSAKIASALLILAGLGATIGLILSNGGFEKITLGIELLKNLSPILACLLIAAVIIKFLKFPKKTTLLTPNQD